MKKGVVLILLFILGYGHAYSETIIFKSGKVETATIIERTSEHVKVDFMGIPITYYLNNIKTINGRAPFNGDFNDRGARNIPKGKVYALVDASIRFSAPPGWEALVDEDTKGLLFSPGDKEEFATLVIFTLPFALEDYAGLSVLEVLIEQARSTSNAEAEVIDFAGAKAVQTFASDDAKEKQIIFVKDAVLYTISFMLDNAAYSKWGEAVEKSLKSFETVSFSEDKKLSDDDIGQTRSLQKKRSIALENVAGSALHTIVSAQYAYRYNNSRYAALDELGSGKLPYIDPMLAMGRKQGYVYKIIVNDNEFYVTAQPQGDSKVLQASFYIDEDGMLGKSIGPNPFAPDDHFGEGCPVGFAQLK